MLSLPALPLVAPVIVPRTIPLPPVSRIDLNPMVPLSQSLQSIVKVTLVIGFVIGGYLCFHRKGVWLDDCLESSQYVVSP